MRRLLTTTLLLLIATLACAQSKQYYSYPNAQRLNDTDRVLVYQNASGTRNITGATLKASVINAIPQGIISHGPGGVTSNIAGGSSALNSGVTANNNIALGTSALAGLVDGASNIALGYNALTTNEGNENIAIGFTALQSLQTGGGNAAIGSYAGYNATSGSGNVFLGSNSGRDALQKVAPQNSVAIGSSTYTTADNQVVLGNSAVTETILRGTVKAPAIDLNGASLQTTLATKADATARPAHSFNKIYSAATTPTTLNIATFGDSLGGLKYQQYTYTLSALFGGKLPYRTNPSGAQTAADAGIAAYASGGSGWSSLTGQYAYWPTGLLTSLPNAATVNFIYGGGNVPFTTLKVYYITEPGGGTFTVSVGGSVVTTIDTNTTAGLGIYTYTQSLASPAVTLAGTAGTSKIVEVHPINGTVNGINYYAVATGGLALNDAMTNAQARANLQTYLADADIDLFQYEMKENTTYGDGTTFAERLVQLADILDAAIPNADKLFIGSTPVAINDADRLLEDAALKALAKSRSYLFWDSRRYLPDYATMTALGWQGDGTHPDTKCSTYLANIMLQDLGFTAPLYAYTQNAVNDRSRASLLGNDTVIGTGTGQELKFHGETGFRYDWEIVTPRTLAIKDTAGYVLAQFSGNVAYPNVLPNTWDFGTVGNAKKIADTWIDSRNYLQFLYVGTATGFRDIQAGRVRAEVDVWAPAARLGTTTNNTSIATDGTLTFSGTGKLPYGSMYVEEAALTVSAATVGTYYPITAGLLAGTSSGFTFQNGSELKCLVAGKYLVNWSMSISSNQSDTVIEGAAMVGSTAAVQTANATKAKEAAVVYSVGGTGILTLNVNDLVKLSIERVDGAAATITINHANLTLLHIGG